MLVLPELVQALSGRGRIPKTMVKECHNWGLVGSRE